MAYYSGIVNSIANIVDAIANACETEGWTKAAVTGGYLLSKGTCCVQVSVDAGNYVAQVRGGTGIAAGALTGPSRFFGIGKTASNAPGLLFNLVFPANYSLHILSGPDEVYFFANAEITKWHWLAFGQSGVAGIPGLGTWVGGLFSYINRPGLAGFDFSPTTQMSGNTYTGNAAPFWVMGVNADSGLQYPANCTIQHGLDGVLWSGDGVNNAIGKSADTSANLSLNTLQPNVWNSEVALLPIRPYVSRGGGQVSYVADLAHARYVRVDNLADGEVITLGPDKWKSYPFFLKNLAVRNGGNNIFHTGTGGWAIRYDGP